MWVRECRVRVIYYTSKPHQRIKERQTERVRYDEERYDLVREEWMRKVFLLRFSFRDHTQFFNLVSSVL